MAPIVRCLISGRPGLRSRVVVVQVLEVSTFAGVKLRSRLQRWTTRQEESRLRKLDLALYAIWSVAKPVKAGANAGGSVNQSTRARLRVSQDIKLDHHSKA